MNKKPYEDKLNLNLVIGLIFLVVFILLLITKNTQGSGDDFALYLQQSQLFFKGENWQQNFFVFNKEDAIYSPKAYSMGYPVLLYPIWYFPLRELLVAKYFQIVCLGILMFVLFYCGKNKLKESFFIFLFPFITAALFLISGAVENILPDIWVVMLGCLSIVIIQENKNDSNVPMVFLGLLYFMLFWLKPVGIVYLWSAAAFHLCKRFLDKDRKAFQHLTIYLSVFLCCYALVSVSGLLDEAGSAHFIDLVKQQNTLQTIQSNVFIYKDEVLALIGTLGHGSFYWFTKPLSYVFVLMCVIGLVDSDKRENQADLFFVMGMCSIILLFPNAKQGIRYFLPLLPFFILYVLRGIEKVLKQNAKWTTPVFCFLFCIMIYDIHLKNTKRTFNVCDEEVVAMFHEIEHIVPVNEKILCAKPRLMGWMAGRKAGRVAIAADDEEVLRFMENEQIQWVFIAENMPHEAIDRMLQTQQGLLSKRKQFKHAALYRLVEETNFK